MILLDLLVASLVLSGVALALLGALGLQQFPDVFARMHAATKPATLGLLLIATGAAIHLSEPGATAKLALVVILQFVTAPVAAHMVGRSAYRTGTELAPETAVDELAGADLSPDAVATPYAELGRRPTAARAPKRRPPAKGGGGGARPAAPADGAPEGDR